MKNIEKIRAALEEMLVFYEHYAPRNKKYHGNYKKYRDAIDSALLDTPAPARAEAIELLEWIEQNFAYVLPSEVVSQKIATIRAALQSPARPVVKKEGEK